MRADNQIRRQMRAAAGLRSGHRRVRVSAGTRAGKRSMRVGALPAAAGLRSGHQGLRVSARQRTAGRQMRTTDLPVAAGPRPVQVPGRHRAGRWIVREDDADRSRNSEDRWDVTGLSSARLHFHDYGHQCGSRVAGLWERRRARYCPRRHDVHSAPALRPVGRSVGRNPIYVHLYRARSGRGATASYNQYPGHRNGPGTILALYELCIGHDSVELGLCR